MVGVYSDVAGSAQPEPPDRPAIRAQPRGAPSEPPLALIPTVLSFDL